MYQVEDDFVMCNQLRNVFILKLKTVLLWLEISYINRHLPTYCDLIEREISGLRKIRRSDFTLPCWKNNSTIFSSSELPEATFLQTTFQFRARFGSAQFLTFFSKTAASILKISTALECEGQDATFPLITFQF